MRKIKFLLIPILLACFLIIGCSSDKAWRKATTLTFEALGITVGGVKTTTETLKAQGLITDEQVAKIKVTYNKAIQAYAILGNALKLASAADTETKKEIALQNYEKLLADFNALVLELFNLINSFKKTSMIEIQEWIMEGGAT